MAIVYPQATLTPSKQELMDGWLPSRAWFDGNLDPEAGRVVPVRRPRGEVGLEGFLLGAEGLPTYLLPLTYRGARRWRAPTTT